MINWIKTKALKLLAGTWLNKAIRDGVFFVATFLLASDTSICQETAICKEIGDLLGKNVEAIVSSGVEIILFVIAGVMKFRAAKPEAVGKVVVKTASPQEIKQILK